AEARGEGRGIFGPRKKGGLVLVWNKNVDQVHQLVLKCLGGSRIQDRGRARGPGETEALRCTRLRRLELAYDDRGIRVGSSAAPDERAVEQQAQLAGGGDRRNPARRQHHESDVGWPLHLSDVAGVDPVALEDPPPPASAL